MVLACLRKAGENLTWETPRTNFEAEDGTARERKMFTTRREDTEYMVLERGEL